MNRVPLDLNQLEIGALFAAERELVPEPDDLRNRVIERARASLPTDQQLLLASRSPSPRRVRIGVAVAAAVVLSALCAAAFFAGYRSRSAEGPVKVSTLTPPVVVQQVPIPSVVVALVPVVPSANPVSADSEPVLRALHAAQVKPALAAKSAIDSEAYAMELRVLQPARQAVAQRDFASALGPIAEHQRRYPSGKLAEEREALRVKALLGLGRTAEAQRAGAGFRQNFPHSVLLGRMDEMLGTQK